MDNIDRRCIFLRKSLVFISLDRAYGPINSAVETLDCRGEVDTESLSPNRPLEEVPDRKGLGVVLTPNPGRLHRVTNNRRPASACLRGGVCSFKYWSTNMSAPRKVPSSEQAPSQPIHPPHSQLQQSQGGSQQTWFCVFKPELDTVAHDTLDPAKRYHEGIFIETDPVNSKGMMFHVTGDVIAADGMRYEERPEDIFGTSAPLHKVSQLGWVDSADYHSRKISAILSGLPTPTKQQGINFWEVDPRYQTT